MDLAMTRAVYATDGPLEREVNQRSSQPVIVAAPVQSTYKSEDLYVRSDHWVGMDCSLTECRCPCHARGGQYPPCGEPTDQEGPNWCAARGR